MIDPLLRERIDRLTREGVESPYLDRLRKRTSPEQVVADVEREIVQEIAQALGRSEERLEHALLELDLVERDLRALEMTPDPAREAELIASHKRWRETALKRRWELEVHREALRMYDHSLIDKMHPIPGPWRGSSAQG